MPVRSISNKRLEVNHQNHLQCIIADPTLPHQFHHIKAVCLLMDSVSLPLNLVIVMVAGVDWEREELSPQGKKSPSPPRIHQAISGNKVHWIHSLSNRQNWYQLIDFNLCDSYNHGISQLSQLIHIFKWIPFCQSLPLILQAADEQLETVEMHGYIIGTGLL